VAARHTPGQQHTLRPEITARRQWPSSWQSTQLLPFEEVITTAGGHCGPLLVQHAGREITRGGGTCLQHVPLGAVHAQQPSQALLAQCVLWAFGIETRQSWCHHTQRSAFHVVGRLSATTAAATQQQLLHVQIRVFSSGRCLIHQQHLCQTHQFEPAGALSSRCGLLWGGCSAGKLGASAAAAVPGCCLAAGSASIVLWGQRVACYANRLEF